MTDYTQLSEQALADLIQGATKALDEKRQHARREVLAKVKALAASIGVAVEIKDATPETGGRTGSKVAIKYRDPDNSKNAWSGRGVRPKWLQAYLAQGRSIMEFTV